MAGKFSANWCTLDLPQRQILLRVAGAPGACAFCRQTFCFGLDAGRWITLNADGGHGTVDAAANDCNGLWRNASSLPIIWLQVASWPMAPMGSVTGPVSWLVP